LGRALESAAFSEEKFFNNFLLETAMFHFIKDVVSPATEINQNQNLPKENPAVSL